MPVRVLVAAVASFTVCAACSQTSGAMQSVSSLAALTGQPDAASQVTALPGEAASDACAGARARLAAVQGAAAGETDAADTEASPLAQVRSAASDVGALMSRLRPVGQMMGVEASADVEALTQTAEDVSRLEQAVRAACDA